MSLFNKNVSNQNALTVDNLNVNVSANLPNNSITTAMIADASITSSKIAGGVVAASNIASIPNPITQSTLSNNNQGLTIGDCSQNLITTQSIYFLAPLTEALSASNFSGSGATTAITFTTINSIVVNQIYLVSYPVSVSLTSNIPVVSFKGVASNKIQVQYTPVVPIVPTLANTQYNIYNGYQINLGTVYNPLIKNGQYVYCNAFSQDGNTYYINYNSIVQSYSLVNGNYILTLTKAHFIALSITPNPVVNLSFYTYTSKFTQPLVVKTCGFNQGLVIQSLSLYQESSAILLGTVTSDSISNSKSQPFYVTTDGTLYCKSIIQQNPITSSLATNIQGSVFDPVTGYTTNPNGSVYDINNLLVSAPSNPVSNIIDLNSSQTLSNKTIDSSCILSNTNIAYKNISNIFLSNQYFANIIIQSGSLQLAPNASIQLPSTQTITNTTTLIDTSTNQTLYNKIIDSTCTFPNLQTQITANATKITDMSWDGTYYYTNFNNNIHCFGIVQSDGSIQTPAINLSSSSVTAYTPGSTEIGYKISGTIVTDQTVTLTSGTAINFGTITNLPMGTWYIQGVASAICTTGGTLSGFSGCGISFTSATLNAGNTFTTFQNGAITAGTAINNTVSLPFGFIKQNTSVRNCYLVGAFTFSSGVFKNSLTYSNFVATRIA